MSHVLLVMPQSSFLVDSRTFPPLGLLYLGAALEANGHKATVVDLAFNSPLEGHNPDLIGIMCLTPHFPQMSQLIARLRLLYPSIPVAVGGPHFSTVPADGACLGADATCVGDGEEAILRIVAGERGVVQSPGGILDVDRYPIPARHLLPIHDYKYNIAGIKATSIITSRGCPFDCCYCSHWIGYRKMRLRAIDNVIQEIRHLKTLGFGAVMLYEDEVNIARKRTVDLAEAMIGEGIKWRAFIKAELFDEEQAKMFAASGCWELCTGVESGSDIILKNIHKKSTVADNTKARQLCKQYGIRFKAFCQVGLPGETLETVAATKKWLIDNRPDELNISLTTPYIGTPMVDHKERYEIDFSLHYDKQEYFYRGKPGEYQPNVSTPTLDADTLARLRYETERDVREAINLPPQGDPATYYNTPRTHDTFKEEECRG